MSEEREILDPKSDEMKSQDAENQVSQENGVEGEENTNEEIELGAAEQHADKVAELEREKTELQDKYLRLFAEFDNYRRRTILEKEDLRKQANRKVFEDLLPVIDDFERGLENMRQAQDTKALEEGVQLIYDKFMSFLDKKGVKVMKSKEEDFDPELHEALTKIPSPNNKLSGKVIDEIEKGYMLQDKVLRHAKVVVAE